jgi:hypothetical protein
MDYSNRNPLGIKYKLPTMRYEMKANVTANFDIVYSKADSIEDILKLAAEYLFTLPNATGSVTLDNGEVIDIGKEIKV